MTYRILVRCNDKCDGGCNAPDPTPGSREDYYRRYGSIVKFAEWELLEQLNELANVTDHDYEIEVAE